MTEMMIKLTSFERDILRKLARQNGCHPRDQARHILRQALGLTETEQESKRDNAGAIGDQPHTGIVTTR